MFAYTKKKCYHKDTDDEKMIQENRCRSRMIFIICTVFQFHSCLKYVYCCVVNTCSHVLGLRVIAMEVVQEYTESALSLQCHCSVCFCIFGETSHFKHQFLNIWQINLLSLHLQELLMFLATKDGFSWRTAQQ